MQSLINSTNIYDLGSNSLSGNLQQFIAIKNNNNHILNKSLSSDVSYTIITHTIFLILEIMIIKIYEQLSKIWHFSQNNNK